MEEDSNELSIDDILERLNSNKIDSDNEESIVKAIFSAIDLIHYDDELKKVNSNITTKIINMFLDDQITEKIHQAATKYLFMLSVLYSNLTAFEIPFDQFLSKAVLYLGDEKYTIDAKIEILQIVYNFMEKKDFGIDIDYFQAIDVKLINFIFDNFDFIQDIKEMAFEIINMLFETKIYSNYILFLPNLLKCAECPEISNMAIHAILLVIQNPITNFSTIDQNESELLEMLCNFIKTHKEHKSLHVFINAIGSFLYSFPYLILPAIDNFDFIYFLKSENDEIFESTIQLFLALMPIPDLPDSLLYIKPVYLSKELDVDQIKKLAKNVFDVVCELYVANNRKSELYLSVLVYFNQPKDFDLKLPNQVILMMYFQIDEGKYNKYILKILDSFFEINKKEIIRSNIYSKFDINDENNKQFYHDYLTSERLKEVAYEPKEIRTIDDFDNFTVFDLLSSFYQEDPNLPQKYVQSKYIKSIKSIIQQALGTENRQVVARKVFNFFFSCLCDMPFPITNKSSSNKIDENHNILATAIEFNADSGAENKRYKLDTTLIEIKNKESISHLKSRMQPSWMKMIDYNQFESDYLRRSTILAYNSENSNKPTSYYKIQDKIWCENMYLFHILPFFLREQSISFEKFNFKVEDVIYPRKRTQLLPQFKFWTNSDFSEAILDIIQFIYETCPNEQFNFIQKGFLDRIESQLKYFFLAVGLVSPCSQIMVKYPFLFPFETRFYLLQLLVREPSFAFETYQKRFVPNFVAKKNHNPISVMKFIVKRDQSLFHDGILIFEHFAKYRLWLEFQFYDEIGIGKGPTREFFSLFSKEFTKNRYGIWRSDHTDIIYATHPQQLFPLATASDRYMRVLGMFCAKCFEMNMTISIPFNPAFFDLVCGREVSLKSVDATIYNSLEIGYSDQAYDSIYFQIIIEGHDIDLVKNGSRIPVTEDNFDLYKEKIKEFICGRYVKSKADKFVDGWSEVLNPGLLLMFTSNEICNILNGSTKKITYDELQKYTVFEGGYTNESREICDFFEIFSEFTIAQQELFLQFVTGYSRLPIGGLAQLDPKFTICKTSLSDDGLQLGYPSASTCFNRLKLPPYASKEIMQSKLLYIIDNLSQMLFVRT